ncbi:MAG: HNH endonuclease [Thermomicrobiales bacterium]
MCADRCRRRVVSIAWVAFRCGTALLRSQVAGRRSQTTRSLKFRKKRARVERAVCSGASAGGFPMARAARRQILSRDNYRCTACGATSDLHVHHIAPRSEGGSHELSNLTTLCFACHERLHGVRKSDEKRSGFGDSEASETGIAASPRDSKPRAQ